MGVSSLSSWCAGIVQLSGQLKEPEGGLRMAGESVKVGENRYRERFGRYFEDFEIGATYEHRPGRTISEADNTWFALLTMNTHPIHFDAEYAKHSEFGKPLVVSTLTLSILVG